MNGNTSRMLILEIFWFKMDNHIPPNKADNICYMVLMELNRFMSKLLVHKFDDVVSYRNAYMRK